MELNAQQTRGKKKLATLKEAEFKDDSDTLKWIKEQATWAEDIKAYEDSIKPVEKETKSKGKK
ncbi:hypothetical protein LCGC14_2236680 [marine sediment metagenome]|uniref:Uncharacterized protein n=1 Tax=marine sediment metagenome TaxID=412755 RepID=A0A0F9D6W6_9ZZZZ